MIIVLFNFRSNGQKYLVQKWFDLQSNSFHLFGRPVSVYWPCLVQNLTIPQPHTFDHYITRHVWYSHPHLLFFTIRCPNHVVNCFSSYFLIFAVSSLRFKNFQFQDTLLVPAQGSLLVDLTFAPSNIDLEDIKIPENCSNLHLLLKIV